MRHPRRSWHKRGGSAWHTVAQPRQPDPDSSQMGASGPEALPDSNSIWHAAGRSNDSMRSSHIALDQARAPSKRARMTPLESMIHVSGNSSVPYLSWTMFDSESSKTLKGGSSSCNSVFSADIATSLLASVEMESTTMSRFATTLANSAIDGISSRQGWQVVVQKLRTTVLPLKSERRTLPPLT